MRLRPLLVDQLVAERVLVALAAVWCTLVGFDLITALVVELANVGQGEYGFTTALAYGLFTLPRRAYTLFPTAAVIGALLGLGGLAASSELTALRAIGLSRTRISAGVMVLVAFLTVLMVFVGETVGPAGEQRAQTLAIEAKSSDITASRRSGLWAREGQTFLNARQGDVTGLGADARIELSEVVLYEFEDSGRLGSIAIAERAVHHGGSWSLHEVQRYEFGAREVRASRSEQEHWASSLNPDALKLGVTKPRYLRLGELQRSLDYLQRNELDSAEFETAYWARIFYPLGALALCMAALPFAFGTLRSGGFGKRLFIGIVLGVGMFTVQTLAVNLAQVYHVDLRLAHAFPPLLVLAASWWYFRRQA